MQEQQVQQPQPLTKQQIAEYKEAFSLFDKDGDGIIDVSDLGMLVRSLNQNPTNSELQILQKEVESQENPGKIEFADFLTSLGKRNIEVNCEEEIRDAFMVLDNNKAIMETEALRQIIKKGEEGLSEDELDQIFDVLDPQVTGTFKIEDFIKMIIESMQNNEIK
eukprot:TRINITY_DN4906_c0_g1_i3.p4 TRINITY_DN4906_c0_g1~~TRINITY_DN4906_c0_g1_i3.p4  ORF type:complete len:164 (+),score=44.38 TRINITY_DN4906_c0_g1_i3:305-796(+)